MKPSMKDKRAALAKLITETLDEHLVDSTTFRGDVRFREAVFSSHAERAEREAIMGKPVRYWRLAWLGDDPRLEADVFGDDTYDDVPHRFACQLWLAYSDARTYAQSSDALWSALLEGTDPAMPGLFVKLRETAVLSVGDYAPQLGAPEDAGVDDAPRNLGDGMLCHYAQFFITVR